MARPGGTTGWRSSRCRQAREWSAVVVCRLLRPLAGEGDNQCRGRGPLRRGLACAEVPRPRLAAHGWTRAVRSSPPAWRHRPGPQPRPLTAAPHSRRETPPAPLRAREGLARRRAYGRSRAAPPPSVRPQSRRPAAGRTAAVARPRRRVARRRAAAARRPPPRRRASRRRSHAAARRARAAAVARPPSTASARSPAAGSGRHRAAGLLAVARGPTAVTLPISAPAGRRPHSAASCFAAVARRTSVTARATSRSSAGPLDPRPASAAAAAGAARTVQRPRGRRSIE